MRKILLAAALGLSCVLPKAEAAVFTFSFSNVEGEIDGAISGTITLPDGDGTFAATSVMVLSAPAALGYATPFDAMAWHLLNGVNSFTVSSGDIVVDLSEFGSISDDNNVFNLNYSDDLSSLNLAGNSKLNSGVLDVDGDTLVFGRAPGGSLPVPELDATGAPMALAWLAGVLTLARRKGA